MKRFIKTTEDGSSTIYVPELDEHYHSTHGAIQESMHVFIEAGLKQQTKDRLNIFEMGFGTGLNCMLTWLFSRESKIDYTSIEKYPVEPNMVNTLNYTNALNLTPSQIEIFNNMHLTPWDNITNLENNFTLNKVQGDIQEFHHQNKYDLVYFDAFAPEVQPQLWSIEIFQDIHAAMEEGGILTTYCAKGEVRRTMQKAGFEVERVPGPPGKREMLRARKK